VLAPVPPAVRALADGAAAGTDATLAPGLPGPGRCAPPAGTVGALGGAARWPWGAPGGAATMVGTVPLAVAAGAAGVGPAFGAGEPHVSQ
jgi:hypothetical protein